MPEPEKLLKTLHKSAAITKAMHGRVGKYLELQDCPEVLIAGDLHGNVENFKKIVHLAKLDAHPQRHVILQELVHGPFRYADGSDHSHWLVDVVATYICQFAGRVHYLLGNHELAQWTGREISKSNESLNQLFRAGVSRVYGEHADDLLPAYDQLFASLPAAIQLPNRIFVSHSLPGAARLDQWNIDQLKKSEFTDADYKLGGCVHAIVWGRDTSAATVKRYLDQVNCDILITGHIPTDQGYSLPNEYQIILDGKDDAAQVLLFSTSENWTQEQLVQKLIKLQDVPE